MRKLPRDISRQSGQPLVARAGIYRQSLEGENFRLREQVERLRIP